MVNALNDHGHRSEHHLLLLRRHLVVVTAVFVTAVVVAALYCCCCRRRQTIACHRRRPTTFLTIKYISWLTFYVYNERIIFPQNAILRRAQLARPYCAYSFKLHSYWCCNVRETSSILQRLTVSSAESFPKRLSALKAVSLFIK